jgi:uncharacterized protein (TIGR02466 family)
METLDLFKQTLVKIYLNENLNFLLNFCLKIKKKHEGVKNSNVGGFHSNNLDKKEPLLNSLIKNIELNSNIMIKNIFKSLETVSLFNIWVNINEYKDFNIPHTHPFSKISGVFYVNAPEKSGDLVFLNDTKIENYLHSGKFIEYNEYNSSSYSIKPEENVLYLFPSWLNHYVKPNLSKEKRISISFNLT